MTGKFTCKRCGERYKRVSDKHYCAMCHKEEFGVWAKEWRDSPDKPQQHMKFNKSKSRNKRKKKK